jgi:hypothetical protein
MKSILKKTILPLTAIVSLAIPSQGRVNERAAFDAYKNLAKAESTQEANKIIYDAADLLGNNDGHPSFQEMNYAIEQMNLQSGNVADKVYGNSDGDITLKEFNSMTKQSKTGNSAFLEMAHANPALVAWEKVLTTKPSPNQIMAQQYVELVNGARNHVYDLAIKLGDLQVGDTVTSKHTINALEAMNQASSYVADVYTGNQDGITTPAEMNDFIGANSPGLTGWNNMYKEFSQLKYSRE